MPIQVVRKEDFVALVEIVDKLSENGLQFHKRLLKLEAKCLKK